jgi:hypothetical protein
MIERGSERFGIATKGCAIPKSEGSDLAQFSWYLGPAAGIQHEVEAEAKDGEIGPVDLHFLADSLDRRSRFLHRVGRVSPP